MKTLFDPACGTGGMLSVAEDYLRELNPDARLEVFGQELNEETYAICRSDMMLKGQDASHIVQGNSFDADGHSGQTFDYMLANPPFGVEWKQVERFVKDERERLGFRGRFGAGLPAINDGSFLFLQHMISKMKPADEGGSRLAIVFNGSPLFTGAAGSGPSEIRRWIIENDWLEAVVALPDQLFYNTGISTYFWVVTNRKSPERRGKVQLVDARELCVKMRKSLGEKRKADLARADRGDHPPLRRLRGERAGQDLPQRVSSATSGSLSSARCGCATRARARASGSRRRRRSRSSTRSSATGCSASSAALRIASTTDRAEALAAAAAANGKLSKRGGEGAARGARGARPGRAGARRSPTRTSATRRTSRCPPSRLRSSPTRRRASRASRTGAQSTHTWRPRCCRTCRTPGSTTTRRRSATRSRSPGTSTGTCRRGRSRRSTPRSARSRRRFRTARRGHTLSDVEARGA